MANRNLTPDELIQANLLLADIRDSLSKLAGGDAALLFAYRRKIGKELSYDERRKPAARSKLKALKRRIQGGMCAACHQPLPEKYTVLDRFSAAEGYVEENTRLICEACDRGVQRQLGYR